MLEHTCQQKLNACDVTGKVHIKIYMQNKIFTLLPVRHNLCFVFLY
jgi:hypothetical protein